MVGYLWVAVSLQCRCVVGFEKRIVYILRSDRNPKRHYTGVTTDIVQRLRWHNAGQNTDTARDRPWSVVVSIEFNTEQCALEFERYIEIRFRSRVCEAALSMRQRSDHPQPRAAPSGQLRSSSQTPRHPSLNARQASNFGWQAQASLAVRQLLDF